MPKFEDKFFLIDRDILPETYIKTLKVKALLTRGEAKTVNEACERIGLSRSTYYKYQDKIFPFNAATYQKIITISLILEHKPGVLSRVLKFVADKGGNILTINQSIPLQGLANVVLSVDTMQLEQAVLDFIAQLEKVEGVKKVVMVGNS